MSSVITSRSTSRSTSRVTSGGLLTAVFSPLDLLPALWLDGTSGFYNATSGGSAVADGGTVARWEDKSGNAAHLTNATAGARPLLDIDGGPTGGPCAVFDGVDDTLVVGSRVLDIPCTVMVVMKRITVTDLRTDWDTRSGGARAGMVQRTGGNCRSVFGTPTPGPVLTTGEWDVVTFRQTATEVGIRVGTAAEVVAAQAVTPAGATSFSIGAGAAGSTAYSNSAFAEILGFDRELTVEETTQAIELLVFKHLLASFVFFNGLQVFYNGAAEVFNV